MKILDKILQNWRINKAVKFIPLESTILDIGAYDSTLFDKLDSKLKYGIGIDPLIIPIKSNKYTLIKGLFPENINSETKYDVITLLAVLEHIPAADIKKFVENINFFLKKDGLVIISVPDSKVDYILSFLTKLNLIDGMSVEEHHGYDTKQTKPLFESNGFKCLKHDKFQLGLNNLFVFKKL